VRIGPAGSAGDYRSPHKLLALRGDTFEQLDIVELNLAIARELPQCRDLDVARYRRTVSKVRTVTTFVAVSC